MKTGILFSIVAFVATFVLAVLAGFALDAILPAGTSVNYEGLGRVTGILLLFIVPAAFISGSKRQARTRARQPPTPSQPENLRPVDHEAIKRTIMQQRSTRN